MKMPEPVSPSKAESQMTLASAKSITSHHNLGKTKGWWKERSKLEKFFLLTISFTVLVIVGLAIALVVLIGGHNATRISLGDHLETALSSARHQANSICLTKGCIEAASIILKRLNTNMDPCEDFYEFACGTYQKNIVIPDEKTAVTQFSTIQDVLRQKLRIVVEEEISVNDSKSTILVKNLYKSCMDSDRIAAQGIKPLKRVLAKMGGWPVIEGSKWNPSSFTWDKAIFNNRRIGYSIDYLVDFSIAVDIRNSSWRIIDIDQPPLGMPSRKYLLKGLDDPDVKAYHEYQKSLAIMLGADEARAARDLKEALKFEIQLANFSLASEDRRNLSQLYHRMTIKQLTDLAPQISWLEYAKKLLPDDIEITEDEPVIVNVPKYVIQLGKLLQHTPKRVIANYLMWRVASASVGFLSDDIRDIQLKYSKILTGKGVRAPRWKECMGAVSGSLSHAVGSLYAQKFFKENAKAEADEMVSYIRAEFDNILRNIDWMNEDTRMRALRKSRAIVAHIAYPKELLIDEELDNLYKDLVVTDGDLLENMRNLTVFGTDVSFGRLREKVNKTHWRNYGAAAVVNAFYSPLENSIQFPAGILQGAFFDADRPKYLNYGGIGFVIGHEITHGFDDKGRQFDENGDLNDWWDAKTEQNFLNRSRCIIWQYGNYTVPEVNLNVNGKVTQGENIADNGGIKEAYRAYNSWVSDHGEEASLPGLSYTPNQLFWVSSAHVWCSKYRPETMKLRIITGAHSPVKFRVNGPMSNIPEFSEDWKCPTGSKMNPIHKCTVW